MEIEVGDGQAGLDMEQISRNKHEKEIILPRNSKMKVLGLRAPKKIGDPIIVRVSTENPTADADVDPPFGASDEWSESDHPRGQPGNAGQFGAGGGGSKGRREPQMGERKGGKKGQMAQASRLYSAPTKTADQIVAAFPGGAEAIARTRARLAEVVPTDALVSEGGFRNPDGTYTAERAAMHRKIAMSFFPPEKVARALPAPGEKPVLTMLGGRGGSGKSWLTGEHGPVDESKSILLDSDAIKGMLPGYEGWNASSFHEESTHILGMADARALELGVNTIHDATLKSEATSAMRMAQYESAGYEVEGYYMYAAPETAATRAMSRYAKGGKFNGRFVPPEIILGNVNNEKNFDKMSGGFRKWAVYDNNAEGKEGPKLVSRSHDD
jgi:predicted ABC-type ATPase